LGLICLVKGHTFKVLEVSCHGVPYTGVDVLEFVDYKVVGECERCGKHIYDYGRARVAYLLQPVSPVLASTPLWVADDEENRKTVRDAIEKYVEKRR